MNTDTYRPNWPLIWTLFLNVTAWMVIIAVARSLAAS